MVTPIADVEVFDVGQLGDQIGADAGFFADFAQGGLLRLLARIDGALGKRYQSEALPFWRERKGCTERRGRSAWGSMTAKYQRLRILRSTTPPAENSLAVGTMGPEGTQFLVSQSGEESDNHR